MAYFQPNNVSGLFLWFMSTGNLSNNQLSLASGAYITYWQDNSGSGNNLTAVASSTTNFPTYQPNVLNGYPSIKFNGTTQYLQVSNNQTLNLAPSSLVIFTVYKSLDYIDQGPVCCNDNAATFSAKTGFYVGLNNPYTSGWYFGWGPEAGAGDPHQLIAQSNNPAIGYNLNDYNQFVLRMDGWQAESGNFAFGKYGAIISTGVASMDINAITPNSFSVGYSQFLGDLFKGEIVEIAAYNRPMYSYEINELNNYFIQKYQFGNAMSCPLYVNGATPAASSTNAHIPLYLNCGTEASGGFPLYTASTTHVSGYTTCFIDGSAYGSGGITLFTLSTNHISGGCSLFVDGGGHVSGGIPLFIITHSSSHSPITLYLNNYSYASSTLPLYVSASFGANSGVNLVTSGAFHINNNIPLYVASQFQTMDSPLYIYGKMSASGGTKLYTSASILLIDYCISNTVIGVGYVFQ